MRARLELLGLCACALVAACGHDRPPPPSACSVALDCAGVDSDCGHRTCADHTCGIAPTAAGTPVTQQIAGDCQVVECDGSGATVTVPDDRDSPDDGNACTTEMCAGGVILHGVTDLGTTCGSDLRCDGSGECVSCNVPVDCPGSDTDCARRTCVQGTCGVDDLTAGTVAARQTTGDCQTLVCDGSGEVSSIADDTDLPVDHNACTADVCTSGVPSNPDLGSGATCGSSLVCDGSGACVGCVAATECPGSDTDCQTRTCVQLTCGIAFATPGTLLSASAQTAGDCTDAVCDGSGGTTVATNGSDVPDDHETCTRDVCTGSVATNPPVADNTPCSEGSGNVCNGLGQCVVCVAVDDLDPCTTDGCTAGSPSHTNASPGLACGSPAETCQVEGADPTSRCEPGFYVVRVGTGAAALGPNATAVFLDEYTITGSRIGTVALPTASAGPSAACTLSGVKVGEGALARSGDGRFVTLGCYNAAPGTPNVSSATGAVINRVAARIDATGTVDTTTRFRTAFSSDIINAVVTADGTELWAGGGSAATGGVWATGHGATSGEAQLVANPRKERALAITSAQLFATSGVAAGVFAIGAGLPSSGSPSATVLPGMLSSNLFGFALLDLDPHVAGVDTLYAANSASPATTGGVQKWTFDGASWTLQKTFNAGLTVGLQSLDAYQSGSVVVVVATTFAVVNSSVVILVDDGSANPAFTTVATAAANTQYRGLALLPVGP